MLEYVELSDPAERRMAAQWGDPATPDGRVWVDLADGKPVAVRDVFWAFRTTAEDHFSSLFAELERRSPDEEEIAFLREQLEALRLTGEALFAGVDQAALVRCVAAWLLAQPPAEKEWQHHGAALFRTFGDRNAVWADRFSPVSRIAEMAGRPLLGEEGDEFCIYCRYSTLELAYRLFKLADHLDRERQLAEAVGQLRDQPAWSPEVHRQAWHAAANAVAIGRRVWVDSSPDGLRMGISPAEEDGPDFSLPLRAGIDAAGFRRTPPDLRPMVAELTAIDAVMPHDPHAQWPETVAARREELLVRLWRTAHGSAWWRWDVPAPVAGYDRDHSDPHRPLVLVVQLPDGPQIRGHVAADAVDEWELADAAVMPWDGAAREGSYRQRVEWLTS